MCEDYKLRLRERELLRLRVGATRKPAPVEHSTGGTSWVKIVKLFTVLKMYIGEYTYNPHPSVYFTYDG